MNWKNLELYRCPSDGEALKEAGDLHICDKCGFRIGKEKFVRFVTKKPAKGYVEPDRSNWD